MQTLRRKDLEVQSLTLQNKLEEKTWSQEKNLLQQELRHFKQDTFLLYVKLKWLLKHWRQGKRMEEEGEDTLEGGHRMLLDWISAWQGSNTKELPELLSVSWRSWLW